MRTGISSKKSARRFRGGSQHTRSSGPAYMPSGPRSRGKKLDPTGCPPRDFIVADCHEATSRPWPRDNNYTILQACPNACSEWMGKTPGHWTTWTKKEGENYAKHLVDSQSEWARGRMAQQVAASKAAAPRSRRAAPAAPRPSRSSKGVARKFVPSRLSRKSKASRQAPAGKFSTRTRAISESSQSSGIHYGSRGTDSSKKVSRIPTDSAIDALVEQVHMMKISSPKQNKLSQEFKPSLPPISESPEDMMIKEAEANREWLKQKRDKMLRMLLIPANKPELYGESYGFGPYMKNIKKIKHICESTKKLGSTRLFEQACKQAKIGVDTVLMRKLKSKLSRRIRNPTAYGKQRKRKGKGTTKKRPKKK